MRNSRTLNKNATEFVFFQNLWKVYIKLNMKDRSNKKKGVLTVQDS